MSEPICVGGIKGKDREIADMRKQIAALTAKIDIHTACSVPVNKPDLPVPFKMPCSVSIRVYIDELQARIKELEGVAKRAIGVCACHATMRHDIPCLSCAAKAALEEKP